MDDARGRWRVRDAMVFIAATAVGIAVLKASTHALGINLSIDGLVPYFDGRRKLDGWTLAWWASLPTPFLAAWSAALAVSAWWRPGPPDRYGRAASLAAIAGVAVALASLAVSPGMRRAFRIEASLGRGSHLPIPFVGLVTIASGLAVAACWLWAARGGRGDRSPSKNDWPARLLGAWWIVAAMISLCCGDWRAMITKELFAE